MKWQSDQMQKDICFLACFDIKNIIYIFALHISSKFLFFVVV